MLDIRTAKIGFLVVAAMVATAEVVARVDDWVRFEVAPWASPNYDIDLRVVDSLGVRGRPNGRYQQFSLNNFGFRSKTNIERLPSKTCSRVMTLGASQTLGYLEPAGEEYPAQLQRVLRANGACFEVLNAGIAGMSLPSIAHTWEFYWKEFRPDIVVLYPSPTPYLGESPPKAPQKSELHRTEREWPAFSFKPRLLHRAKEAIEYPAAIQRIRTRRWLQDALARIPADSIWDSIPRSRVELYRSDLDRLSHSITTSGSRLLLLTHATRFPEPLESGDVASVEAWRAQYPRATPQVLLKFDREAANATRELAAAKGYELVDIACLMTGRRQYFGDPIHFTESGAAKVAEAVAFAINGRNGKPVQQSPVECTVVTPDTSAPRSKK